MILSKRKKEARRQILLHEAEEKYLKRQEEVERLLKVLTEQHKGRSVLLKCGLIGKLIGVTSVDKSNSGSGFKVEVNAEIYEIGIDDILNFSEIKKEKKTKKS